MIKRRIGDIIPGNRIVQLPGSASVREASRLMAKEHVGAVLVMREERLEGIFTERDALNRVLAKQLDPESTTIDEVMTRQPKTVDPDASAIAALRMMRNGGYRHLPVARGERVVGVVSLRDFFGAELAEIEEELDFQAQIAEGPDGRR